MMDAPVPTFDTSSTEMEVDLPNAPATANWSNYCFGEERLGPPSYKSSVLNAGVALGPPIWNPVAMNAAAASHKENLRPQSSVNLDNSDRAAASRVATQTQVFRSHAPPSQQKPHSSQLSYVATQSQQAAVATNPVPLNLSRPITNPFSAAKSTHPNSDFKLASSQYETHCHRSSSQSNSTGVTAGSSRLSSNISHHAITVAPAESSWPPPRPRLGPSTIRTYENERSRAFGNHSDYYCRSAAEDSIFAGAAESFSGPAAPRQGPAQSGVSAFLGRTASPGCQPAAAHARSTILQSQTNHSTVVHAQAPATASYTAHEPSRTAADRLALSQIKQSRWS